MNDGQVHELPYSMLLSPITCTGTTSFTIPPVLSAYKHNQPLGCQTNIQPHYSTDPTEILTDITNFPIQHNHDKTVQHDTSTTTDNITFTHPIPAKPEQRNRITTIRLLNSAKHCLMTTRFQLHIDGGANRSITQDYQALLHFKNIKPFYMSSASKDNDIKCTGIGDLPWTSTNGTTLLIKCYYSPNAIDETVVSPSDIMNNHITQYHSWTQHANMMTGTGTITFTNHTNNDSIEYPLVAHNGLWYYEPTHCTDIQPHNDSPSLPMIHRLTTAGYYELIHARLGHPGECIMQNIHHHVDGITKMTKPPFHKCKTCMLTKATKCAIPNTSKSTRVSSINTSQPHTITPTCLPGQRYHIDMGFVRGSSYCTKDKNGHLITSLDGYNSYLVIVDRASRYTWVFLSKHKVPQVKAIESFLAIHGNKQVSQKFIRTDEGGELGASHTFQRAIQATGYILEPTASDASFQNRIAEQPNCTLGDMMRALLHGAQLGPQYWSWALVHVVYLKNRLPHTAIAMTPYQAYTGNQPDISKLCVFGSPVISRSPGKRPAKLDTHAVTGIFLGFTATEQSIYYQDTTSKCIKIATHVSFDEASSAHTTRRPSSRPHDKATPGHANKAS
jgi:hypothetical protein